MSAHLPENLYMAGGLAAGMEYRLSFEYENAAGESSSGNTSPAKAGTDGKIAWATALVLPTILEAVDQAADGKGGKLTLAAVHATDLSPLGPKYTIEVPVA